MKLDGETLSESVFRQKAGYVIQADRLMANLTVKETLTYTALLQAAGEDTHSREHIENRVSTSQGQKVMSIHLSHTELVGPYTV